MSNRIDDEMEDDIFCENLLQKYLNDDSPDKHDTRNLQSRKELHYK